MASSCSACYKMSTSSGLASIRQTNGKLEIINQLLLPHVTEFIEVQGPDEAFEAIKSMKIRGAPAIASLAALSVAYDLSKALNQSPPLPYLQSSDALARHVHATLDHLFTARPTAVNLGAAVKRLKGCLHGQLQARNEPLEIAKALIEEGHAIADEDIGRNKEMAKHGGDWLRSKNVDAQLNVLTVCNTGSLATSGYGTALGLITYLHDSGALGRAYYTQTTPYHQGSRLTAYELKTLNIPSTMICDTMVGSLFQHHKIHAVAVGADRIAKNGDTANKIGTYNAAVLAQQHSIPFLVVAPTSTVDLDTPNGTTIPIEHRPPLEACTVRGALWPKSSDLNKMNQTVVMVTPEGIDVYNPSFDVTPAELITAVVTEKGVATKQAGATEFDLSSLA